MCWITVCEVMGILFGLSIIGGMLQFSSLWILIRIAPNTPLCYLELPRNTDVLREEWGTTPIVESPSRVLISL